MKMLLVVLLIAAAVQLAPAQRAIVLEGATVIDMVRTGPIPNAVVVFQGSKLVGVGRKEKLIIPDNAEYLDVRGKFIIPGLIDPYVPNPSKQDLLRYLAWGITSVGGVYDSAAGAKAAESASREDSTPGPQVIASAFLFAGSNPPATAGDARRLVREAADLGLKRIVLDVDDLSWNARPRRPLNGIHPDIVKAILDEAGLRSLDIIIRSPILDDIKTITDTKPCTIAGSILDARVDASSVMALQNENAYFLTGNTRFNFIADPIALLNSATADRALKAGIPAAVVREMSGADFLKKHRTKFPGYAFVAQQRPVLNDNLETMLRNHISVVPSPTMNWLPGINTHLELESFVKTGIEPYDVLYAATALAATYLRKLDSIGSLVIGKDANFVVLDADPLKDVRNLRKISSIVYRGKTYSPRRLLQLANR